jgi:O-antigen/teichoic acid export membrane protein
MLSGWVNHLRLTAKARTGLSQAFVVFALIAAIAALAASIFFVFAAFIWLAERYSPLTAALVLALAFLLIAILCVLGALVARRRTVDEAKRALAVRSQSPLLDPGMLGMLFQVGRTIGLRRVAPLVAAGVLAAALAKEWFRDRSGSADDKEQQS